MLAGLAVLCVLTKSLENVRLFHGSISFLGLVGSYEFMPLLQDPLLMLGHESFVYHFALRLHGEQALLAVPGLHLLRPPEHLGNRVLGVQLFLINHFVKIHQSLLQELELVLVGYEGAFLIEVFDLEDGLEEIWEEILIQRG